MILLVQPPVHDPALAFNYAAEPLGLETIAATVPDHEVRLLDLRFSREPLSEVLLRERPTIVATGGYTVNYYDLVQILRTAKRLLPGVRTVVGGHHATIRPSDFALPEVDAVVLSVAEETFPALVSAIEGGQDLMEVAGLALFRDGRQVKTAPRPFPRDLNASPLPRRELTARYRNRYRAFGHRLGLLNTSRGCPYHCTFCSIINEMGSRYLIKSAERVIEELATIPQPFVRFADGNTFGSRKRARLLAVALREARHGKRFMVDARADAIVRDPKLFEDWHDAGLRLVAVGLEAATDRALSDLGKGSQLRHNIEAIRILRGAGLEVIGQFIVDPAFEERDFDDLLAFVQRHRIHYPSFTILTPFPATALWEERSERLVTRDWRRYDVWHSVEVPRLGWDRFYRRFMDLYETCYGPERALRALRERLDPSQRKTAASPVLLGAVALQIRLSRRALQRAYGLRRDRS